MIMSISNNILYFYNVLESASFSFSFPLFSSLFSLAVPLFHPFVLYDTIPPLLLLC